MAGYLLPPVPCKPSPHRRLMLRLSKMLKQQDISELLYLSDFISQAEESGIQCGVDLMKSLERHGRLGPGRYEYLASCLVEIGRVDLVQVLYSDFGVSLQPQLHWKRTSIQEKKVQFLEKKGELHKLLRDTQYWETWVSDLLQQLAVHMEHADHVQLRQPVEAYNTNQTVKAAIKLISGTIQHAGSLLAKMEQHTNGSPLPISTSQQLERLVEDLSTALSISPLQCAVPSTQTEPIQRLKDQHPLSVVATKMFTSLLDFFNELCGEAEAKKKLKDLEESVATIKVFLHTNAYLCFGFLSLVHLTDTVALSDVEVLDQEAKEIISSLVLAFPPGATLTVVKPVLAALEGTSVLEALKKDKGLYILFQANPEPQPCPCKANKSLRFGLLTVLLTLYKSASLTRCEWKRIQSRMMQQFRDSLSEPNYNPFLEIDTIVMNSLERLFKHFSTSTLPTDTDISVLLEKCNLFT